MKATKIRQFESKDTSDSEDQTGSPDNAKLTEINAQLTKAFRSQYPNPLKINFDERLAVISNPKEEALSHERAQQLDISNEVFREVKVYQGALENAKRAIKQLEKNHTKLFRPADFFAEMFKTESQMKLVQRKLEGDKARLEKLEVKKEKAIQKRFHKQTRHTKNLEASKEKRRNLDAIQSWKTSMRKGENKKLGDFYKQGKASDRGSLGSPFAGKGKSNKKIGKKGGKGFKGASRGSSKGGSKGGSKSGSKGGSKGGRKGR